MLAQRGYQHSKTQLLIWKHAFNIVELVRRCIAESVRTNRLLLCRYILKTENNVLKLPGEMDKLFKWMQYSVSYCHMFLFSWPQSLVENCVSYSSISYAVWANETTYHTTIYRDAVHLRNPVCRKSVHFYARHIHQSTTFARITRSLGLKRKS